MERSHADEFPGRRMPFGQTATVYIWALIAAVMAFGLVQGRYIGVQNFFSPMHHDDLSALASDPAFHFWLPRPVSSNFIYVLGAHGAGVYYCIYFALWMVCAVATQVLACRLFNVRPSAPLAFVLTFLSAFAWFSLGSSVMTMQYLGLSTNGLSYLFGILATLALLDGAFGRGRVVVFAILLLLSAFAKEDMLAFLCGALVWRALDNRARTGTWQPSIRQLAAGGLLVVAAFALSVLHSKASGSPFTSGSGAYDLSSPLANVLRNAAGFYDSTPATRIMIQLSILAAVIMFIRVLLVRTWHATADLVAVLLPFGLALPYLALPRFVEYYVVTFLPLAIALFPLAVMRVLGARSVGVSILAAVLLAAGFYAGDRVNRAAELAWNAKERTISRRQIQELERAAHFGLAQCQVIAVTGTSSYLGPFLAGNPSFVDKEVGAPLTWRIATVPGTIVDTFAKVTSIPDKRWKYLPSAEQAREGAHCLLAFDEQGYARLQRLPQ